MKKLALFLFINVIALGLKAASYYNGQPIGSILDKALREGIISKDHGPRDIATIHNQLQALQMQRSIATAEALRQQASIQQQIARLPDNHRATYGPSVTAEAACAANIGICLAVSTLCPPTVPACTLAKAICPITSAACSINKASGPHSGTPGPIPGGFCPKPTQIPFR